VVKLSALFRVEVAPLAQVPAILSEKIHISLPGKSSCTDVI
jgi:hypothetical protein